ncbi:MAG: hypothetical protein CL776_03185 [Chloroflexi bacterium]|nr:hypothetical protein [Chloroflexota bacterium]
MISRVLEEFGISTVGIALVKEHALRVKVPRALAVPFPFGHALGKPGDPEYQLSVINACLSLLEQATEPTIADWTTSGVVSAPLIQYSAIKNTIDVATDPANEITKLRHYYERRLVKVNGRTSVGLSGIDQRKFRKVVRFLDAYSAGSETIDLPERPMGVSKHQYVRYLVDDLKAFYYEAFIEMTDGNAGENPHDWFWSSTSIANLINQVAQFLDASENPEIKAIAFGIVR